MGFIRWTKLIAASVFVLLISVSVCDDAESSTGSDEADQSDDFSFTRTTGADFEITYNPDEDDPNPSAT
jgi:hypothetical protein